MSQKRHTMPRIVAKLRKADVELGKGIWTSHVAQLRIRQSQKHTMHLINALLRVSREGSALFGDLA